MKNKPNIKAWFQGQCPKSSKGRRTTTMKECIDVCLIQYLKKLNDLYTMVRLKVTQLVLLYTLSFVRYDRQMLQIAATIVYDNSRLP